MGDNSNFVFRQKLVGEDRSVRWGAVMVKQQGLFSPKLGAMSDVFARFQAVAAKLRRRTQNSHLAFWDKFFVHNPLDVKENYHHALEIAFHLSGMQLFHWEDCRFVSGS